jgi:lactate/malate dehydrogenase, alpha/beta C-terminal domain
MAYGHPGATQNLCQELLRACGIRALQGSATLSMAYAGALFADACLRGLNGDSNVVEPTFVESKITELPFFASKVRLGPSGEAAQHSRLCACTCCSSSTPTFRARPTRPLRWQWYVASLASFTHRCGGDLRAGRAQPVRAGGPQGTQLFAPLHCSLAPAVSFYLQWQLVTATS